MASQAQPRRGIPSEDMSIFVCDIQEKFRSAIFEFDKVVLTAQKVLKTAHLLRIPIYVTTQNSARLGTTVSELNEPFLSAQSQAQSQSLVVAQDDKTLFSMWTPAIRDALQKKISSSSSSSTSSSNSKDKKHSVVIVGIESHICVTQTTLDLLKEGYKVYVLADGVSSCNREEIPLALARLRAEGATVTSSESWMYEAMGDAGIPEFKSMVGLVKETSAGTKAALSGLLSKM